MSYDVLTIGSATVDVFATTASQLIRFSSQHDQQNFIAYPLGSKLLIEDLQLHVGGGGTNAAVSFAKLGFHTAYLGKIGTAHNASLVLNTLSRYHIDFLGPQKGRTGYSIILESSQSDRTILTFKGSNNELSFTDIPSHLLHTPPSWIYASSMVGSSFTTLQQYIKHCKKKGSHIAFNPSSYQTKQGYAFFADIFPSIDVLLVNKEEAQQLLHTSTHSPLQLAYQLAQKSAFKHIVVVTDGAWGAACAKEHLVYHITPSSQVTVRETTGAGDAFGSAFVAGLLKQYPLPDCLTLAMVQAESVIEKIGAKEGLLLGTKAAHKARLFNGTITKHDFSGQHEMTTHRTHHQPSYLHDPFTIRVPPGKQFRTQQGKDIHSLEELDHILKSMKTKEFSSHVNADKNDFAQWVQDVFGMWDLAYQLRKTTTPLQMRQALHTYLHTTLFTNR